MGILKALLKKEFSQIVRDPSAIIIAFILPVVIIFLYMYGINMDTSKVKLGIKPDDGSQEVAALVKSFGHSDYINSSVYDNMQDLSRDISASRISGAVIIPNDFSRNLAAGKSAEALVITDGAEANTANYVQNYTAQIINGWLSSSKYAPSPPLIGSTLRVWYNESIDSHYFILPGSLAVTMNMIGLLLTALVVAREWENGTIEGLLATSARKIDIILSKYIPYFTLGFMSLAFNVLLCITVFKIPFRGNLLVLFGVSSLFLFTALGIGLLISSICKNQFLASQLSIGIGFLPALMLSGLMFPINSMPVFFQYLTMILPPRYFISFIESEFMTGTVWEIVVINSIFMSVLGIILFTAVYKKTDMRLNK